MVKPELLCPAGDRECLEAAVQYGADAVYLGAKTFGMRAAAKNFDIPQIQSAVEHAHANGVKVYLTVNVLPRNRELDAFPAFIKDVQACGVDAVIAADLGVITKIREITPDLPIHASTQTGVVNYATATALWNMGCERVVLAREMSVEEIAELRAKTPQELELEAFVHGAMCMSISGRCLLSEYLTGRDANRGACAQSCRWKYALMEEKRPNQFFPIGEDEDGSYILNAKDLCMAEHLETLAKAGISSFKIEGRAKAAYYVAGVANAYRMAMDCVFGKPKKDVPAWVFDELDKVSHRPYTTGFFFGQPSDSIHNATASYVRNYDVVGIVQRTDSGRMYVSQRNRFFAGDTLEILAPYSEPMTISVSDLQDGEGNVIEAANHAVMDCSMAYDGKELPKGAFLRKKVEESQTGA